jgi:sec-independent protein translocase protein TatC
VTNGLRIGDELVDHLAELRTRLVRSVIYLIVAVIVAWCSYSQLITLLTHPMSDVLRRMGSKFLYIGFPEAFMVQMQVCLIAGLIIASPLITGELWGFVSPGLRPSEKRPLKWIAPLAVALFFSGVTVCYLILPAAFRWFASYVPANAELRPSMQASVLFTVKMLLVFGIVFELPVVLMVLAKLGVVSSRMLRENWRIAMVLVSVVAAVATPSNDAFSMLMMAIPVAGLYFVSILLVRLAESDLSLRNWLARVTRKRSNGSGK